LNTQYIHPQEQVAGRGAEDRLHRVDENGDQAGQQPTHSSGCVSTSGSRVVRRSMPDSATSVAEKNIASAPVRPAPKRHAQAANSTAVSSSTKGYCQLMRAPQERHLPRNAAKLISGIFSNQRSLCPQCGQCDDSTAMPGGAGS
jgi:hypothetical protein